MVTVLDAIVTFAAEPVRASAITVARPVGEWRNPRFPAARPDHPELRYYAETVDALIAGPLKSP